MRRPLPLDHPADDCRVVETHTACPRGYLVWHEWAEKMAETHDSTRCPACGLWAIWVPRG